MRVTSAKNAASVFAPYVSSFSYTPSGAVTRMQLGNGQWQGTVYNSRLQATQISQGTTPGTTNLLQLDISYGSSQNNGNLLSQTITVPTVGTNAGFTATQMYSYDPLNRLSEASEIISSSQTWKQAFVFDRFGNRNFDEANTTTLPKLCNGNTEVCSADRKKLNPAINAATNRLSTNDDYAYSNNGNMTGDAHARTFKYDGENKQYEVRDTQNQIVGQYYFDGNDKRVKKVVPSTGEVTIFAYDLNGRLSAEYSTNLSATQQVSYVTADHLGSPRIKTDQNGAVIARHDYHSYGEDISSAHRTQELGYKSDEVRQRFTGYERDIETDLDFAQARYYSKSLGRFNSVDPIMIKRDRQFDPQRINLYGYVRNNPLKYKDVSGKDLVLATADKKEQETLKKALTEIARTKSGREFLQKLEDSKVVYRLGIVEGIAGGKVYGASVVPKELANTKGEKDGVVTVVIDPAKIQKDTEKNAKVDEGNKVDKEIFGGKNQIALPNLDVPQGKSEEKRNAAALGNELIQATDFIDTGRTDQTQTERERSIPAAMGLVNDKDKAKGDAKKFVEEILEP
ncbi:MAG: RHS repeat domain-containing protein [Pyrinomonadaceae bacterium]